MLWIFDKYGEKVRFFEHPWTVEREWLVLIILLGHHLQLEKCLCLIHAHLSIYFNSFTFINLF